MVKKKTVTPKKEAKKKMFTRVNNNEPMVFGKKNYILMAASFVVIIIGFIFMSGKENVVDVSSIKLTVAPVVVMIGFVIGIYSVLVKAGDEDENQTSENTGQPEA
jgi:uncharacterized membrane protein